MGQNKIFLKEKSVLLFGQCPETRMSYYSPVDGHKGGIFAMGHTKFQIWAKNGQNGPIYSH